MGQEASGRERCPQFPFRSHHTCPGVHLRGDSCESSIGSCQVPGYMSTVILASSPSLVCSVPTAVKVPITAPHRDTVLGVCPTTHPWLARVNIDVEEEDHSDVKTLDQGCLGSGFCLAWRSVQVRLAEPHV